MFAGVRILNSSVNLALLVYVKTYKHMYAHYQHI